MGATTLFLFFGRSQVTTAFKPAVTVGGLVTLIAFYHYWRIFDSWESAYKVVNGVVTATGIPFNDAYRYVDWLLTVPLLMTELILVMKLSHSETAKKASQLAGLAALMIIPGYPGEISSDPGTRWMWWGLSMIPFLVIVYQLVAGLASSVAAQPPEARGLVNSARYITLITWSFYPIVFVLPMLGISGPEATTAVQVGYTIADILAKAGFGLYIYAIAVAKSEAAA
ncbi:MAG: bacteriorhodopsin-like [Acidobacteriota bacterium]